MDRVLNILSRIECICMFTTFKIVANYDMKYTQPWKNSHVPGMNGRIYLQAIYKSPCSNTGKLGEWKGRKNYLSDHMTDDEIVKTAYVTFKQAVEHEVMEGFRIDGKLLFNPHINFEELLLISNKEVKRSNE